MATCDHPTDLVHRIGYPWPERAWGRDSRYPSPAAEEKRELPLRTAQERDDVANIFYVIESRPRNSWAVIGSLAFLTVIVLALIIIPLLHTDPLPKRETLTMLYLQPPAASGASSRKLEAPRPASSYTPKSTALVSPVGKPEQAPPAPASASGVVGGVPGGMVGGIPGGALTDMSASVRSVPVLAKSPDVTPPKRIRVAARVAEANLIHDVPPQYPPEAGRARVEGSVVLMAVIGKDGSVEDVRVESGLPILAQAAINAVKQWRYKPYLIDGEPVEIDSRITINFTLSAS
jgi:periplasmic protein TonB